MAKQEKVEEEQEKKEILLPWQQADGEAPNQVVGWENGAGIDKVRVHEELLKNQSLRHEHRALKKYLGHEGVSVGAAVPPPSDDKDGNTKAERKRARPDATDEEKEPVMPPVWKAWYSTIPGLDGMQAYKKHLREEERKDKMHKAKEKRGKAEAFAGMDGDALEAAVENMKKEITQQEQICKDFDGRISKALDLDKKEERHALDVARKLQRVSYKHGVMEGKLRSSETYFQQIYGDTRETDDKKVLTLMKSCNLMLSELANLKTEVRGLLKEARERKEEKANSEKASQANSEKANSERG